MLTRGAMINQPSVIMKRFLSLVALALLPASAVAQSVGLGGGLALPNTAIAEPPSDS